MGMWYNGGCTAQWFFWGGRGLQRLVSLVTRQRLLINHLRLGPLGCFGHPFMTCYFGIAHATRRIWCTMKAMRKHS